MGVDAQQPPLSHVRRSTSQNTNGAIPLPDPLISEALYEQFVRRARAKLSRERAGISLGASDLVQQALLRMWKGKEFEKAGECEHRVLRAFTRSMRQTLVDRTRRRNSPLKMKGHQPAEGEDLSDLMGKVWKIEFVLPHQVQVQELIDALDGLKAKHPELHELVEMKYFGGFREREISTATGIPLTTLRKRVAFARTWLARELRKGE